MAEQVGAGATTGTFGAAPAGDIVILAVPYSAVLEVVKLYGEQLAGKLLVDITNPVDAVGLRRRLEPIQVGKLRCGHGVASRRRDHPRPHCYWPRGHRLSQVGRVRSGGIRPRRQGASRG
ncbi:NAD(P)-binding domain-containing protein [Edaphobacter sp. HDX4]|uniref:NAD(P)-binding domain-containing protein n=1 Tax=Edaphobacter sp. HDX4 TaxID=2794064 RepID=UPI003FA5F16A